MKIIRLFVLTLVCMSMAFNASAQKGGGENDKEEFLPGAVYEIRYWQDMTNMSAPVYLDTMFFFNNDRAIFEYTNNDCISCDKKETDSLVYMILPKISFNEKEIILGENIITRLYQVTVPFRGYDRTIYKLFITDMKNKGTGLGEYVLVSKQFGIIYRYNSEGQVTMLSQTEVLKDGKEVDIINMLPLQMALQQTDIFIGVE